MLANHGFWPNWRNITTCLKECAILEDSKNICFHLWNVAMTEVKVTQLLQSFQPTLGSNMCT